MTTNKPPRRRIPGHRQGLYYFGLLLMVVGFVLFMSTFVRGCANFGDFTNFDERVRTDMGLAIVGFLLIAAGQVVGRLGKRGLAGSGIVLDPKQAREDLEPWSRMAGGMVEDALDETGLTKTADPQEVVKVRCPACKALNDEHDRFCGQCGGKLA